MNKANILSLADLIEQQPDEEVDMSRVLHLQRYRECGTPSCIAGWAAWEQLGRPMAIPHSNAHWNGGRNPIINAALDFFGTADTDLKIRNDLFRGNHCDNDFPKDQVVRTLRHFAETGEIDWSIQ